MNLLKKQGFYNSITLYIGTALGFFNLIILFSRILTPAQIGFFALISSISLLITQFASIGFSSIITRYFPFFKSDDRLHSGFPLYVFKTTLLGFVIVILVYILGKELIQNMNVEDKGVSYFYKYYYLIIPVALLTMWYNLAETFARATFHNIIPSFLREVLLKIFTTIAIVLIFLKVMNYETFIYWYVISTGLILLLLLLYMKKLDLIRFGSVSAMVKKKSPEILKYGFYSVLASGSFVMIQNIDNVMLKIFSSEATVGYYYTLFNMAVVISLPAKALNTTSYQIIADAWKTEDLVKINKIYSKTSLVQFLIGCLLLIGLLANWQNILVLLKKPEYINHYSVFIVVGLGFLCDITGGLNGVIISFSKHYRLIMFILIGAALMCAGLNVLFIPHYGMLGAALAYSITMFALNFTYWLYLTLKFKLQPFNPQFLKLIVISLVVLALGLWLPNLGNFFLDVFVRSFLMLVFYSGLIYFFKISLDINEFIDQILHKLKIK
ncbi:MAG: polysaccharide biosynthesis C-terminal domain-containing protein [Pelobium sp.]